MAVCQSYHSPRNIYIQHLIHCTKSLSFLRIWNVKKEDHHKPTDNQLLIYAYIFTYINVIKLGSEPLKGIYFQVFINEPFFVLFLSWVLFYLIVTFYHKTVGQCHIHYNYYLFKSVFILLIIGFITILCQ